jgi:Sigma-70, region 4
VRTATVKALIRRPKRPTWRHETRSAPPDLQARLGEDVVPQPRLRPIVRTLPPRQRAVIVLRYYGDLNEQQTAAILGCYDVRRASTSDASTDVPRRGRRLMRRYCPDRRRRHHARQ